MKKFHPDHNKNSRFSNAVTKVINKLNRENRLLELRNLYERVS